ncbi:MAG: hypothetical protein LBD90_01865, partial [Bifidobacteriaceae bacterium]|nr:hypothetical protein [Bifidobacteriaceae bacterium]
GALVRFLIRLGEAPATCASVLEAVAARPGYEFWPDALDYRALDLGRVRGHRQVTDSYLAALAASRGKAKLATFDAGLAQAHPRHAYLVPELPGGAGGLRAASDTASGD